MSEGGDFNRRTANYHPNIWGDRFINYNAEDEVRTMRNWDFFLFVFQQFKKEKKKNQSTSYVNVCIVIKKYILQCTKI